MPEERNSRRCLRHCEPSTRSCAHATHRWGPAYSPLPMRISQKTTHCLKSATGTLANLSPSFTEAECEVLVNKGILPLIVKGDVSVGDYIFIEQIREAIVKGATKLDAYIIREGYTPVEIELAPLTEEQRKTLLNQ